jgi:tartrate-resistant acid phosphatase type 5
LRMCNGLGITMRSNRYRLLFVCIAIAATWSPLRAAEPELAFAVVGDWGKGNAKQKAVAEVLGKAAESIGARFIVSAGDNFYPRGVTSVSDPNWKTLFENVYTAPSLMVPWHAVLGNHDHRGSTAAQIEYSKTSTRWRLPAPFYKHSERITDAVDADFFFLDTTPLYQASRWPWRLWPFENEQYAWLKRELAASTADWKIVVGHHPVYSGGSHGNTSILIEKLQPLFEQFGVDAYFNGHDHALEHVVKDNVNYFTVGAGAGGSLNGTIEGSRFLRGGAGFMTARLHASDLQVEFFDENGASVYRAEILKSRKTGSLIPKP